MLGILIVMTGILSCFAGNGEVKNCVSRQELFAILDSLGVVGPTGPTGVTGPTGPTGEEPPPPPPPDPPAEEWPYVADGRFVNWLGHRWVTRYPEKLGQDGSMKTRNATLRWIDSADAGRVGFHTRVNRQWTLGIGGGRHFCEILSRPGPFSDRRATGKWSRVEIAASLDMQGMRVVVHEYESPAEGPLRILQEKDWDCGPMLRDTWEDWVFEWEMQGRELWFQVIRNGVEYPGTMTLDGDTPGPGVYFGPGHWQCDIERNVAHPEEPQARSYWRFE